MPPYDKSFYAVLKRGAHENTKAPLEVDQRVHDTADNFGLSHDDAEEIIEMIEREEGLSPVQAEYYNFTDAFGNLGDIFDDIKHLKEYMEEERPGDTIKDVWDAKRYLFPLTSGKWVSWRF